MVSTNQAAGNAREAQLGNSIHWSDFAACKGRTSLFFAPRAERPQARLRRETQAGAICAKCTVVAECRTFARENHEYGYWGSESEEERHRAGYTVSAPIGIRARPATIAN
ncbi:MAG: WhiB family transcriptional regulator [Actinomycetota bacterium]